MPDRRRSAGARYIKLDRGLIDVAVVFWIVTQTLDNPDTSLTGTNPSSDTSCPPCHLDDVIDIFLVTRPFYVIGVQEGWHFRQEFV